MVKIYAPVMANKSFTYVMAHKGCHAALMATKRLPDHGRPHALPPGEHVPVYPVDALPGCPEDWMRGQGSYVCPVAPDWGLWFNFTQNDAHSTAVLMSVKGMNPITGQKLEGLGLEKYQSKCPVHNIDFKGELFCEKCNYKWPPQSFVSYPNTLWWDGFRQPDGTVRQFFFSEDEKRDIASAVIGKQNTVPAFGFAFYQTKEPRFKMSRGMTRGGNMKYKSSGPGGQSVGFSSLSSAVYGISYNANTNSTNYAAKEQSLTSSLMDFSGVEPCSAMPDMGFDSDEPSVLCFSPEPEVKTSSVLRGMQVNCTKRVEKKDVAVGAGAQIQQDLLSDSLELEKWKKEPTAIIRLYFVFREEFGQIIGKGLLDLEGKKQGYLDGLPVG